MGDRENSDDWLPAGWKTEVRVRKNGKKDKFYSSPSGEVEFQSKLGVLRYLKDTKDTLDKEDDEEQESVRSARSEKKVVFEKATPDGLPPGWTKEVKITKKGSKIRRDSYYTDPVTGYIFRSMKDALRYIDTGDLGRLAFKPKDKEEMSAEVEEDDTSTPAATKKQKLEDAEVSSLTVNDPRPKSCVSEKDELTQNSTPGESLAVHDHTNDQCGLGAWISSSDLPVAESVNPSNGENGQPMENGVGSDKSKSPAPTRAAELLPSKQSVENVVGGAKSKSPQRGRSMKEKHVNTPRRTSKRLAGVPLDGALELKTESRTRRVVAVQSHDMARTVAEDTSSHENDALPEAVGTSSDKQPEMSGDKHSNDLQEAVGTSSDKQPEMSGDKHSNEAGASNQLAGKGEVVKQRKENQEIATAPPLAVQASTEEHPERVATDVYIDQKPEPALELPLGELWKDPCIAFAIQTLTGSSFYNSDCIKVSVGEHNRLDTSDSACLGHPSEVSGILSKTNEETASSQSVPPVDAWSDPCIEFAIKTLTDAIPLDYGLVIQDFLPKQSTSPKSQPNTSEFHQAKFLCQPFGASSRPTFNQPSFVEPATPLPGTTSLQYPTGATHQRSDKRSKKLIR